ncbi:MAG: hypothetical protein RBR06_08470 [Desulfuromonadaceae bacterium]|nr:hypothetical protein [Desulfuromonadaceae bacterium]
MLDCENFKHAIFHRIALFIALCISGCLTLCMSGCTDDSVSVAPQPEPVVPVIEEPTTQKAQTEATTAIDTPSTPEIYEIPAALQDKIKLNVARPAVVCLELTEQCMTPQDILRAYPLTQISVKKKTTEKTLIIRGGVLLNAEAEELKECITGAEVNFDLKWK